MDITKKLKIVLGKMLQTFSEVKTDKALLLSDMQITLNSEVFITDEAGETIPAPTGDYIAEDGTIYVVTTGIVTEVKEPEEETKEDPIVEEKPIEEPEVIVEEPTTKELNIDEIIAVIAPMIEEAILKAKEDILSELETRMSKFTFSKAADIEIKDIETKVSKTNKAANIMSAIKK